jgi:hypothetical protein
MEKTATQKPRWYGLLLYLVLGFEKKIEEKDGWE